MLFTVNNISKTFRKGETQTPVLKNISLDIDSGEFISVMGPSGCGKSTLLYVLSGMEDYDSGEVLFDGENISTYTDDQLADLRRKDMGFVFQQPTFLKNYNLLDNILLPAVKGNEKNIDILRQKAHQLMERVGIGDLKERKITEASGGQLQRVGICRALINEPKIIFADEPTGALNSKSTKEIMKLFTEIHAIERAVFLVTHDVNVAIHANRILLMKDGEIAKMIELGSFEEDKSLERITLLNEKIRELDI